MVIWITSYIWDTGALSLFFSNHNMAVEKMREIKSGSVTGFIPSLILSEFYYKTWQKFGKQAAQVRSISIRENLLEILELVDDDVFRIGELKVKHSILSLADCVLLTIAKRTSATILTTDEPMTTVSNVNSIKFDF